MNTLKIAVTQFKAHHDAARNTEKAVSLISSAASKKADVVCLQELFTSPYFPQYGDQSAFDYAEPIDGPSLKAVAKAAKASKIYVIAPFFEKRARGVYYNSAVVFDPAGKNVALYRKLHVPQDAHSFSEKYYFAPGDLGYVAVDTPLARLGILICWDQWYPEAARATALKGAEVLFYPTAIGWHKEEPKDVAKTQLEAWKVMHQSHAIANGVFVAASNRVGSEGDLTFWGNSMIVEPSGKIIKSASTEKEEVVVSECDLRKIEAQRHGWPFLRDRRVDTYGDLLKRFNG